jgi:hypothetical protein
VFEPNTGEYAAVRCASAKMNARLVMVGTGTPDGSTTELENACRGMITANFGVTPTAKRIWIVSYTTSEVECFFISPQFTVVPLIGAGEQPVDASSEAIKFDPIGNTLP